MIDNKKLLVTITVLAIVGVLSLFAYSTTIKPLELKIGEITATHAGSIIRTSGIITRASVFADGSMSLTLGDFNESSSIPVYFPSDVSKALTDENLIPGTQVRVQGEVRLYQEAVEISISRADELTILLEANGTEYELRTVMPSIQMFDGMEITTSGEILEMNAIYTQDGLLGTSFQVMQKFDNQSYYLQCMCFDQDLTQQFADWDAVRVTGTISFYDNRGYWQMVAEIVSPV
jgi:DNA/RNA endonuclease YhcR with UshA esterase domain